MEAAEIREARNMYMREYYKNNKDKFKAAQRRYWEKKAKELIIKEKDNGE